MGIVRAAWQLSVYLLIGIAPCLFSIVVLVLLGKKRARKFLIAVDLLVCVLAHGEFRTISGMTGEKNTINLRYFYQMKVIDFLLKPIDGPNHCCRADEWERLINYNFFKAFKD